MTWVLVALLALASFGACAFLFKAPRKGWEAIGAALLLGIAGFALQARPAQPGVPKVVEAKSADSGAALISARKQLAQADGAGAVNQWMVIADGLARNGQFGDAAGVVLGAVEKDPRNADAWLSLANNLVAHAEGSVTPAALYAYRRAALADPEHPGPPFFMGLALIQNGRLEEGRTLWAGLLASSPADAPWRADLSARIGQLDELIAGRDPGAPTR
ncbi:tetratricopeptide repeat protein [Novosphingobium sp.]|uniref:tetratricopeptide repeat protein n=1 Tax=Novosphingobium sp. TaxID=1874826 RepID=UPI001EB5F358|nr:tetratricopeptide repeat protein [Novosphingobium sp.]MBK9011536.1 tetratricopeptide repeat protein [Novosphingobium sp.]